MKWIELKILLTIHHQTLPLFQQQHSIRKEKEKCKWSNKKIENITNETKQNIFKTSTTTSHTSSDFAVVARVARTAVPATLWSTVVATPAAALATGSCTRSVASGVVENDADRARLISSLLPSEAAPRLFVCMSCGVAALILRLLSLAFINERWLLQELQFVIEIETKHC